MTRLRFLMVGGFLGAGKTTTLARLARHYMSRGRRVGLVTNDQAQDLVDTNSLRSQGFAVTEVAGACFCCRFNDLVERAKQLQDEERPDVILAEPVGSCTDLVATVVQPLKDIYGQQFQVAPYAVLFKPSHGLRILRDEPGAGFSPKAAYIFRKQLEEADAIVINRIDELPATDLAELAQLLEKYYPSAPVLRVSAKTGQGFEGLIEFLDQDGDFGRRILDIDYDTYAEGEAELGWLNSSVHLAFPRPAALDTLLIEIVSGLRDRFNEQRLEAAHLKAIGLCDNTFGVANLVSNSTEPELSLPSRTDVSDVEVVVNARVASDPAHLECLVRRAVDEACRRRHGTMRVRTMQSFRPGRPQPTHRYATAKS
ncbi:MAG TPA: GTP-binding protein [Gemmataceae bacterium]|nr:GTP-binding protein [Gemmataceae bacterium]